MMLMLLMRCALFLVLELSLCLVCAESPNWVSRRARRWRRSRFVAAGVSEKNEEGKRAARDRL
ncbi:hypothetical protein, partial [Streptomyces sp. NPDC005143]